MTVSLFVQARAAEAEGRFAEALDIYLVERDLHEERVRNPAALGAIDADIARMRESLQVSAEKP